MERRQLDGNVAWKPKRERVNPWQAEVELVLATSAPDKPHNEARRAALSESRGDNGPGGRAHGPGHYLGGNDGLEVPVLPMSTRSRRAALAGPGRRRRPLSGADPGGLDGSLERGLAARGRWRLRLRRHSERSEESPPISGEILLARLRMTLREDDAVLRMSHPRGRASTSGRFDDRQGCPTASGSPSATSFSARTPSAGAGDRSLHLRRAPRRPALPRLLVRLFLQAIC